MSVSTAATVRASERPLVMRLMKEAERRNFGLLKMIRMPVWLELILSVVLLDYTLFIWHYLTHKVPFLWRLHQTHHVDLDLDASTALRFHPVEMLLSAPWRGAQVFFLGISPLALSIWQTMTLLEIMFHHSNIKLPLDFERRLSRFIVTQRMHGIHHSIVPEETGSNWSTIFTWPDYVHGTLQLNVPQDEITIGVPAYPDEHWDTQPLNGHPDNDHPLATPTVAQGTGDQLAESPHKWINGGHCADLLIGKVSARQVDRNQSPHHAVFEVHGQSRLACGEKGRVLPCGSGEYLPK